MQFKPVSRLPGALARLSATRDASVRRRSSRAARLRIDTIMPRDTNRSSATYRSRSHRLEQCWQELCARYLPLEQADSIWRYHHVRGPEEPTQGWKLHLS